MAIPLDEFDEILRRRGPRIVGDDEGFEEGFIEEQDDAELDAHWQRFRDLTGKDVYPLTASPVEVQEFFEWLLTENRTF